jgi:tRNA threonylcarbamoyladenosine biosynthesis protein TsaE
MPEVWQPVNNGKEVSHEELMSVAKELSGAGKAFNIWLFFGEMGSGKTTLIKAIGEFLGVRDTMSSPTFSLVNEYQALGGKKIYHFDLYRLKNEKEIFDIGVEEYFYSDDLCLVEWPEKLGTLTPPMHFKIRITPSGPHHRKIEYQHT